MITGNFIRRRLLAGRAKRIKMVIMDVDGVLTDGTIIISSNEVETKKFSVYDGVAINLGRSQGLDFALITARKSRVTELRAAELGIRDVFQVSGEKIGAYREILEKHNLKDSDIAYIGDDIHDVAIMKRAGLSAAPSNALAGALSAADYITVKRGGEGAVRELVDFILGAKGKSLTVKMSAFLICLFLLAGCARNDSGNTEPARIPPAAAENQEKVEGGFHYVATERGVVVMEIEGERAAGLGAASGEIIVEQPVVRWFRGDEVIRASGATGYFYRKTNDFVFKGGAEVEHGQSGFLSAERIKWFSGQNKLEAEGNVEGEFLLRGTVSEEGKF